MDQVQAQFGVRVGLHRTSSSNNNGGRSISSSWLNRLAFGISYEKAINDQLKFRPELLFSQYGASFSEGLSSQESVELKMNFIQLPLLLKYHATNSLFFEAGPYLAYGIGNLTTEACVGGFCVSETSEFDSSGEEGPKPFDYGASLGLGYRIFKGVSLGVRYNLGLANLATDEVTFKNKSLLVSVSYDF